MDGGRAASRRRGAARLNLIVVHSLDHCRAAIAAAAATGRPAVCITAPGAAGYAGAGYLERMAAIAVAEGPPAAVEFVIDCGEDAGIAMAALRAGWRRLTFAGRPDLRERIAEIAAASAASLVDPGDGKRLDLLDAADPEAACRTWLAAR